MSQSNLREPDSLHGDVDGPDTAISVPESADAGEGGKLKMIVQLVKKCLGVKDIAAMRLSLPASLLEPIPNLEYWHYLDRPDMFAAINDSDDPFERMLAVLRFTFTKDLKFVHGKVCKPYNSVLGEHFRAHWDVIPVTRAEKSSEPPIPALYTAPAAAASTATDSLVPTSVSETASMKSGKSSKSTRSGVSALSKARKSPSTAPTSPAQLAEANVAARMSRLSLGDNSSIASDDTGDETAPRVRIVYMTEQVSHHPPVSAYFAACPARSLELLGIDQISAKVSGTTVRVAPGSFNQGIFVRITGGPGAGEMYNITHPVASVNGILRGSFYVTVGDSTIITCTGGAGDVHYRAIIEYKEESWLGRAHFLLEGVIHTYTPGETVHEEWTKVKHVPRELVVAEFDGSWRHLIRWRRVGAAAGAGRTSTSSFASARSESAYATLLDLSTLKVIPKAVRPLERQLPYESRRLWAPVTDRLVQKEFGDATREKVVIEQRQRDEAAERKRRGVEFVPRYFERDIACGYPTLTEEGRKAVEEELKEESPYCIEGVDGAQLAPP